MTAKVTAAMCADDAAEDGDDAPVLHLQPLVVVDAQLDAGEQVGALVHSARTVVQRLAEPFLEGAHRSSSDPALKRASSAASPRCRCVLTELRDTPRVAAMSSMPSSS